MLRFIKKLTIRIGFWLWMLLIIANIMWLYYFKVGIGLKKLHNLTHKEEAITDRAKKMIATNFIDEMNDDLFTMNCDLGDEGAVWRFMLEWNKMCVKENATTYVLNHELVHYALWNMPVYKKMEAKPLIQEQIKAIWNAVKILDEDTLSFDDWTYYKILKDHVNMFAWDGSYMFYNWVELGILTHRWNEEFITYAIWPIVDIRNQKLEFVEYKLEDPLLVEIDQKYKKIYWLIAEF